jgi:hypothetical protein
MIQPNLVLGGQNGQTKRNFGEGFVERSQLSVRLGCSLDAIVQDKRKGPAFNTRVCQGRVGVLMYVSDRRVE